MAIAAAIDGASTIPPLIVADKKLAPLVLIVIALVLLCVILIGLPSMALAIWATTTIVTLRMTTAQRR